MDSSAWHSIGSVAVSAAAALVSLRLLLGSPIAGRIVDHPNHRSMHVRPTPRIGGLGVVTGFALATALLGPGLPALLWGALALVVATSLADDLRGLSPALRLPLHLLAAALAARAVSPGMPLGTLLACAIGIAWMINLYNFMDGLDGLAGGQAVFGFGAYALGALHGGDPALATAAAAAAGASLGFLRYNFPPARIFLGDAGSTALGLLAGALGLAGVLRGLWPAWFPVIAFLPFVFDATATLADRILRRRRFWEGHREHVYQRLSLLGFGHLKTALVYYALMASSAAAALAGLAGTDGADDGRRWAPAVAMALAFGALYLRVRQLWHRRQATGQGV
jgi:UDP-N-acetylmuramyl pentapeptide phosphotransferase/UDP-N-acetylglucosamine-1-phosphate transferase